MGLSARTKNILTIALADKMAGEEVTAAIAVIDQLVTDVAEAESLAGHGIFVSTAFTYDAALNETVPGDLWISVDDGNLLYRRDNNDLTSTGITLGGGGSAGDGHFYMTIPLAQEVSTRKNLLRFHSILIGTFDEDMIIESAKLFTTHASSIDGTNNVDVQVADNDVGVRFEICSSTGDPSDGSGGINILGDWAPNNMVSTPSNVGPLLAGKTLRVDVSVNGTAYLSDAGIMLKLRPVTP